MFAMKTDEFKEGDVIRILGLNFPLIYHLGIVVNIDGFLYVYHNSPGNKNVHGGSIVGEKLYDWLKGRKAIKVDSTGISKQDVLLYFEKYKYYTYNVFSFNCEHFVKLVTKGTAVGNQSQLWAVVAFYFILRRLGVFS